MELALPTEIAATLDVLREVRAMMRARAAGERLPDPPDLRGSMVRFAAEAILAVDELDRDRSPA